ncbi:hypothetical protein BHU16_05620 [Tannerella sp. oral taxon 808]|nr:hypothetical protein BHU16_05620 [Tannerella sp. oral taxon 808]
MILNQRELGVGQFIHLYRDGTPLHDACKEGCPPRGGKGVFPEAGRVSSPRREGCLPRGGKGVFLEAGRVSSPRCEEDLHLGMKDVFTEV